MLKKDFRNIILGHGARIASYDYIQCMFLSVWEITVHHVLVGQHTQHLLKRMENAPLRN